jgi:hypothetical protein
MTKKQRRNKTRDAMKVTPRSKTHTKKKRSKLDEYVSPSDNQMNCNPGVTDTRIGNETCYTPDVLSKIQIAYNKNHDKDDQIHGSDHHSVLRQLRERLSHCSKEDCWLNQIKEPDVRRQLDEILFAPDKPREWKRNPISWLSNYDILDVLRQYETAYPEFKLLGPSAIDYDTRLDEAGQCVWNDLCRLSLQRLIDRGKRKLGIVFNLDEHDQPGSHWVSMFIDIDEGFIFYYDSALHPVPHEISRLKREIIEQGKHLDRPIRFKYMKNSYDHQKTNTECGMYSIFFIVTFLTRKLDRRILTLMRRGGSKATYDEIAQLSEKQLLELFMKPGLHDDIMRAYRNIYFN